MIGFAFLAADNQVAAGGVLSIVFVMVFSYVILFH
jgi:hypothetical protein